MNLTRLNPEDALLSVNNLPLRLECPQIGSQLAQKDDRDRQAAYDRVDD